MSEIISNPHHYFDQFIPERDPLLIQLEEQAARENIHIVGPVVGELLYLLTHSTGAKKVLELGTSIGYSTVFLANAVPDNGKVTTIEYGMSIAEQAENNFKKMGLLDKIELVFGEALCVLRELRPQFDLIFMDIDKEFYIKALPDVHRLLRPGGLLIADNTALPEAHSFNIEIATSPNWRLANLFAHLPGHGPIDDGICIAMRV